MVTVVVTVGDPDLGLDGAEGCGSCVVTEGGGHIFAPELATLQYLQIRENKRK